MAVSIEATHGEGNFADIDMEAADAQMGSRRVRLNYLSHGTSGGMPSVGIAILKDDGTWFVFETTAAALNTATAVVRGWAEREGILL